MLEPKNTCMPTPPPPPNRYDRQEWAGALGDLGTLMPFVIAYVSVLKMNPSGILFAFGVCMVVCGWYYRTPFPVQPMKAAGAVATTQAAQSVVITQGAVHGAALVTGLIWLVLGTTGLAQRITRWVAPAVSQGIVFGLGLAFMLQGTRLMAQQWALAGTGLLVALLMARSKRLPGIFLLLAMGVCWTALTRPELLEQLTATPLAWQWPQWSWGSIGWDDLVVGAVFLALPQVPLTLGNAVIGIREENNRLFPDRPVTDPQVATSTGMMNVFSSAVGGVPMCHGAGGMAGHMAFGARTGGSLVILGSTLLLLALVAGNSVMALFAVIPVALLGVILFMTGLQLASGPLSQARDAQATTVFLVTAGLSVWNVGVGFVAGMLLHALVQLQARR